MPPTNMPAWRTAITKAVDPAPTCVSCHMPARTYMVVDVRHDHGFRIPRPDLSAKLGTTNACNDCHADKSPDWAASAIEGWHGPNRKGFQNYAEAFRAAWSASADAPALLAAVASNRATPGIARASALAELAPYVSSSNMEAAHTGLVRSRPDGAGSAPSRCWVRCPSTSFGRWRRRCFPIRCAASASARRRCSPQCRPQVSRPPTANASSAPRRSSSPRSVSTPTAPKRARRWETFYALRKAYAEAESEYRAALELSPQYAPASINLADLYRQTGRDGDGESVLRTAISASPKDAGLHHVLGLALTRLKKPDDALAAFARAAELEPDRARYAYVYAVALHTAGRADEAMTVLKDSLTRHPDDRDTLLALVSYDRDAGNIGAALEYAERLARNAPNDRSLAGLVEDLRRQENKPQ